MSGFIVDLGIQLTLMFWRPAVSEEYVLYILSGLWGMSDGIWETQINGLFKHTHLIYSLVWTSHFSLTSVLKALEPVWQCAFLIDVTLIIIDI